MPFIIKWLKANPMTNKKLYTQENVCIYIIQAGLSMTPSSKRHLSAALARLLHKHLCLTTLSTSPSPIGNPKRKQSKPHQYHEPATIRDMFNLEKGAKFQHQKMTLAGMLMYELALGRQDAIHLTFNHSRT